MSICLTGLDRSDTGSAGDSVGTAVDTDSAVDIDFVVDTDTGFWMQVLRPFLPRQ